MKIDTNYMIKGYDLFHLKGKYEPYLPNGGQWQLGDQIQQGDEITLTVRENITYNKSIEKTVTGKYIKIIRHAWAPPNHASIWIVMDVTESNHTHYSTGKQNICDFINCCQF